MTDLSTLLSRVESGSGADRGLDAAVERALFGDTPNTEGWQGTLEYTTDLNAVVALVEAKIPGRGYDITYRAAWGNCTAAVIGPTREATPHVGSASTPARALLAALIRAEMEKVK